MGAAWLITSSHRRYCALYSPTTCLPSSNLAMWSPRLNQRSLDGATVARQSSPLPRAVTLHPWSGPERGRQAVLWKLRIRHTAQRTPHNNGASEGKSPNRASATLAATPGAALATYTIFPNPLVRYPIHPRVLFGITDSILLASAAPPNCTSVIMVNHLRHKTLLAP